MHGFACAHDGVPCDIDAISKDGRMRMEKVCSNDPNGRLRKAIEVGVDFTVVKWVVFAALGKKMETIIMGALNTVQQTSEGSHSIY